MYFQLLLLLLLSFAVNDLKSREGIKVGRHPHNLALSLNEEDFTDIKDKSHRKLVVNLQNNLKCVLFNK